MIVSSVSFAMHVLVQSWKAIGSVGELLGYLLPQYGTMASRGIKFNSKHLRKGDPLPPFTGKLRLYNMRYCPFAQRTVLALNAKQIDYEIVNINLYDKPEWLNSKSAFGKVPALEIKDGVCIYESLVTVEYLDEVYPQRPLLSKDPVTRAYDKIIIEASNAIFSIIIKFIRTPDAINEESIVAFHKALDFVQEQLKGRGTKFLGGSQPGFADYMIWPWFERLLPVQKLDSPLKIDGEKYKLLLEYCNNLKQDPVIAEYLIPEEILVKYHAAYKTGSEPNYELMTD